ncbi:hypothetical protein NDU88_003580 [Pleurodeles waltl]|uniref:Uncharacterized protein n=1 Tax=Pleurodeles waltl TaxID=8319 RepID=A0AAV7M5Q4_PLEWA|nr:hypothetical protein NDU88_003580 [Pleurodeles waltl]
MAVERNQAASRDCRMVPAYDPTLNCAPGTYGGTAAPAPPSPRVASDMDKHRQVRPSQGNTIDQDATTSTPMQHATRQISGRKVHEIEEEPTRAELLTGIHGSREALEGKKETVGIEVNLLCTDLCKVSDKVRVAERSIE